MLRRVLVAVGHDEGTHRGTLDSANRSSLWVSRNRCSSAANVCLCVKLLPGLQVDPIALPRLFINESASFLC